MKIIGFIILVILTKLIDNNLPSLDFKNLKKIYKEKVIPVATVLLLLALFGWVKMTKSHEEQKNLLFTLSIIVVVLIGIKSLQLHKAKQYLPYPDSVY